MLNSDIKVSIICAAYNHEKYIAKTLESFVKQKTNFKFEVICHDDASNDDTAKIILEFQKKYPQIIKPIIQSENQYSKGKSVSWIMYEQAQGKYIAMCEGDDYWIDENKLQKQFDYMETHSNCTMCFTNAIIENQENGEKRIFIPYTDKDEAVFLAEQEIYEFKDLWKLSAIPTASIFFPKKNLYQTPESFRLKGCPKGDLRMRMYFTGMGYAYFINETMCLYRAAVPGSATTRWRVSSKKESLKRAESILEMFDDVDEFFEYKYSETIDKFRENEIYDIIVNSSSLLVLREEKNRKVFSSLSFKKKIVTLVKIITPDKVLHKLRQMKVRE